MHACMSNPRVIRTTTTTTAATTTTTTVTQNESSYAPVYTAVRDRVMAQEEPMMVELSERVAEIKGSTSDLYQVSPWGSTWG